MRRIGLGFIDDDAERARLHRDIVNGLNAMIGSKVEVTTPNAADAEFAIRHPDLGHAPTEAHVLLTSVPGTLYASRQSVWTPTVSFWKFTGASARLTVRLR